MCSGEADDAGNMDLGLGADHPRSRRVRLAGMNFDVITIFPGFFESFLKHGLFKRAIDLGIVNVNLVDLRDFTDDRHRTVDDRPFGGGPGMVLKPEPLFRAVESLRGTAGEKPIPVILLSPQGNLLRQQKVVELAGADHMILICGRYEGVDERVVTQLATDEISIGDYVLSGGELAAAVVMEAVTRFLPGAMGNDESIRQDSFSDSILSGAVKMDKRGGLLDCPHYTRPADFRGMQVPPVLLSGNHEEIAEWRKQQALAKTAARRPDLLRITEHGGASGCGGGLAPPTSGRI
jgi:tRNA (guanine37-N1)-methyltransferase